MSKITRYELKPRVLAGWSNRILALRVVEGEENGTRRLGV